MKVIIAGGTRMVGRLVLQKCLGSENINKVVSIVRKPTGISHHKLSEVVAENLEDYANHGHGQHIFIQMYKKRAQYWVFDPKSILSLTKIIRKKIQHPVRSVSRGHVQCSNARCR